MGEWKDYYQILGVDYKATDGEIKDAYRYKCQTIHPDKLRSLGEKYRQRASEELKWINKAYDTLKDPEKKRRYDLEWLQKKAQPSTSQEIPKPKPVATPPSIVFDNVVPGEPQTDSFILENYGGPYGDAIEYSEPGPWIRIVGLHSVNPSSKLPLQFEIEATGKDWGKDYVGYISVWLGDQEARVKVELNTKTKPLTPTSPSRMTAKHPVKALRLSSLQAIDILVGIVAGLSVGSVLVYILAFETGSVGLVVGRVLVGLGTTALIGTGYTLLGRKENDLFLFVAGFGIAIGAGVVSGMYIGESTAKLVGMCVITCCAAIGGAFAGRSLLSQTTWSTRRKLILVPVFFLAAFLCLRFAPQTSYLITVPRAPEDMPRPGAGTTVGWSPDLGRMAIVSRRNGLYVLDLSDLSTQRLFTFAEVGASDIWYPRWSPDGKQIAVTMRQPDPDLYVEYSVLVVDVESMSTSVVTRGMDPAWSPSGDSIASILVRAVKTVYGVTFYPDKFHVYSLASNKSVFTIEMKHASLSDLDWGPDEQTFLIADNSNKLWIVVVGNAGRAVGPRISVGSVGCKSPRWSADGKSIAWITEWCEGGKCGDEILIAQWDGQKVSEKTRITRDGGYKIGCAWSPDGQKLHYYIMGQGLYSIDVLSGKRVWIFRE